MRTCLAEIEPICRACGLPVCQHPDPVFAGILPDAGQDRARDGQTDGFGRALYGVIVHHPRNAPSPQHGRW